MTNWRIIALIPVAVLAVLFAGNFAAQAPFSAVAIVLALFVALITFHKPENGLIVILFSMMLSPELKLSELPGRAVTIRVDDLLIIVMFVAWLAHRAVSKDDHGFVKTPLDKPLLALFLVYCGSTTWSIITGGVNPAKGFFYTLKYFEYFILYWSVANISQSRDVIPRYLTAASITGGIVTIYAYTLFSTITRVYAPFDAEGGEPASLGGYYLIVIALLTAFALHAERLWQRVLCIAGLVAIMPPFIRTFSRASYLAFIPLLLTILVFSRKNRLLFGAALLGVTAAFPLLFPALYRDISARVMDTFTGQRPEQFSSFSLGRTEVTDQSALERIESWKFVMKERLLRSPASFAFGSGVTGVGFIEGQFFLTLGEIGVIGTLLFYGLLLLIFLHARRIYRAAVSVTQQSLALALLACVVGLIAQSLTTNTFIIVRIMEPFWFLTALVMISPELFGTDGTPAPVPLQRPTRTA